MWGDKGLWLAIVAGPIFWFGLSFFVPIVDYFPTTDVALFYLQMIFLYPLLEEIVFRGAIQPYLHRRLNGRFIGPVSWANVLTSLLFSLFHWVFRSATTAVLVYLPSLLFGHFKDKYNSLKIPIALHCYYNAGFYLLFVD